MSYTYIEYSYDIIRCVREITYTRGAACRNVSLFCGVVRGGSLFMICSLHARKPCSATWVRRVIARVARRTRPPASPPNRRTCVRAYNGCVCMCVNVCAARACVCVFVNFFISRRSLFVYYHTPLCAYGPCLHASLGPVLPCQPTHTQSHVLTHTLAGCHRLVHDLSVRST